MPNLLFDSPDRVQSWLDNRRRCVGASDAAAVAGLSPWKTALGVWVDKVMPGNSPPMNAQQEAGLAMEPGIARLYERRFKVDLAEPADPVQFHAKHPCIGASLDRVRKDGAIVEIKNVNNFMRGNWGEDGTDEVPEQYIVQCQQQMAVADTDRCEIAALFGGSELRVYPIPRNERAIDSLIRIETAFWRYVETKVAPPADWSHASTPDLIIGLNRPTEGMECQLEEWAIDAASAYEAAGAAAREHEADRKTIKARLIESMGIASIGHLPDGRRIVRNEIQRKEYTVAATSYFDFRIKAPKGR